MSETRIAQIIGILSMPIPSRLYAAETFGVSALFIPLTRNTETVFPNTNTKYILGSNQIQLIP